VAVVAGYPTIMVRTMTSPPEGTRTVILVNPKNLRYDVGLDPINVNLERMVSNFKRGAEDLGDVWKHVLRPETLRSVANLARTAQPGKEFHMEDELWVRMIYEFACAARSKRLERATLLKSITPLYLGRVASFVVETADMGAQEVEQRIERLCLTYEDLKPYLVDLWFGENLQAAQPPKDAKPAAAQPKELEV